METAVILSHWEEHQTTKKMNREEGDMSINETNIDIHKNKNKNLETPNTSFKQIIGPLIDEVKALRESFHSNYNKLDQKLETAIETQKDEFTNLEVTIVTHNSEVSTALTYKIETNATNINQLLEENILLKKENESLRERTTKIEISQLGNNIIMLSGMPEQPWESYESTKERVMEAIATSIGLKMMQM